LTAQTRGENNVTERNGTFRDPDDDEVHLAPRLIPPGVVPKRSGVMRPFDVDRVMPIPCRTATFIVWIEGEPYAGFENKGQAYDAIAAWRQRWPAVAGKNMHVVER
jgi:hypothetical protein